jgi:hypothetical protein
MQRKHLSILATLIVLLTVATAATAQTPAEIKGTGSSIPVRPAPIFDPTAITLQLQLDAVSITPTGDQVLHLSWTLSNRSGLTIWVEQGMRMPYHRVLAPDQLLVGYAVVDPRPTRPYAFEVPEQVKVDDGASLSGTTMVQVPVHTTDHFHLPSTNGTAMSSPFELQMNVGYFLRQFVPSPGSTTLVDRFIDEQRLVASNKLQI